MTTPDDRCSRCDHERFAHGIDGCLVDGGEQLVPCFCPGYYVAPKPSVEPDTPFSLTLKRRDGTTVEVRTNYKWRREVKPFWRLVCKLRTEREAWYVATDGGEFLYINAPGTDGGVGFNPNDFLLLADDLRDIRSAMGADNA